MSTSRLSAQVAGLSHWIDSYPNNVTRDPEALRWARIAKIVEEQGEVVKCLIGLTASNPRKGSYSSNGELIKELLDVVVTGLCAVEHETDNRGLSISLLEEHLEQLIDRAKYLAVDKAF